MKQCYDCQIAYSHHWQGLKMIGKGFVLFKINSSPTAFCTIKPICISWLVFKVSNYFLKIVKMKTRRFVYVLVHVPSAWLDDNIHLVCAESAVKFNIWDVVSIVLRLIIMSSDEIDSLGLFTVGFEPLQAYIMSVWHQMSVARTQPLR